MASAPRSWHLSLLVLLAGAVLLWPALVNGGPFYFSDTTTYVRTADAAVYKASGVDSEWTRVFRARYEAQGRVGDSCRPNDPCPAIGRDPPVTLAGRSIYYGFFLYAAQLAGSFWPAIAVQALLTALCIVLTASKLRETAGGRLGLSGFPLLVAILALLTPVAYFASLLMPDIWTALSILSFAHLAIFWKSDSKGRRAFWSVVLLCGLLFHTATVLLIGLSAIAAALLSLRRQWGISRRGLAAVAIAVLLAIGGEWGFSWAVEKSTGAPPVRPPFLTARIIADGPGYRYLVRTCPDNGFVVCRYLDRLPVHSDVFLWSGDPRSGVFSAVSPEQRRRIAEEQGRFVLAVLRDRPLDLTAALTRSVLRQFAATGMSEFNYDRAVTRHLNDKLPGRLLTDVRQSRAYHQAMPVAGAALALLPVLLVSLAIFAWRLRPGRSDPGAWPLRAFVLTVAGVIVLNSAISGAVSTPHDRYQMRVIWLLPLAALAILPSRRFYLRDDAEAAPA